MLEKRIKFIKETINQIDNEKKELQKALKNAETNLKNHKDALHFRKNIFNVIPQDIEMRREKAREKRKTMTEAQKVRNKKQKHESYLRKKREKK
jgi:F0F1-type ATP synthase membrane subunit b/b'